MLASHSENGLQISFARKIRRLLNPLYVVIQHALRVFGVRSLSLK